MKALVIYVSVHHGNTAKIARVVADVLKADLARVAEIDSAMLDGYDLIGFGSGIYFGKHHRTLLSLVDSLSVAGNKKAFVFATSGLRKMWLVHNFSKSLRRKLELIGFDIVAEFSCRGLDTFGAAKLVGGINKGRPGAGDQEEAEEFARTLMHNCTADYARIIC